MEVNEGEQRHDTESTTHTLTGSAVGRFIIRERLGAGGMGEVYRAEDPQLKRTVAIKRLLSRSGDGHSNRELLREAQRASALNHPRIATVYDVFTVGEELFLVMEYIDGMTLRQRIASPIAIDDFHAIAAQCIDGLAAAHARDILHGDLKPSNIMLTREGDLKICDFGLARRLQQSGALATSTVSVRGPAGTPAYMAPEVVYEQPLDERADIFSLGIVFYEMLAGRHPFLADGVMSTVDRVLNHSPDALDRINPRVSPRLAATIQRMLEKDRSQRIASVTEVGNALASIQRDRVNEEQRHRSVRRLRIAFGAATAIGLLALGAPQFERWTRGAVVAEPLPGSIHIAVLPFEVLNADAGRQFFTRGLSDTLNAKLSRLTVNHAMQVTTAADVRNRGVTTPSDARELLGANLALSGSLRYSGTTLEIICRIVDTRSGRLLRAETVTADAANPVGVDDRLVEATIRMLGLELNPAERRSVTTHDTPQPGAYDYYLQARGYLLNYDRLENVESAITVFRKALENDRRYALAYAGLGEAYWRKHELTGSSAWVEPARAACEGALGINPDAAEPHACLGMVLAGTGEYEKAAAEYSQALEREPTDDVLYLGLANTFEKLGQQRDAEQAFRRAIELRPHYWGAYNMLGAYYYRAARYDDALAMFQQVVALTPDSYRGYSSIGAIYFMKDQTPDAIAAFQKSLAIRPNYVAASNLATLYYFEGDFVRSADLYRQALSMDQRNYQVWFNLAGVLQLAGAPDALDAYRRTRELLSERLGVNSRDASLQIALADCDAALGDMVAARADLEHTLKLAPTDAHTLFRIAVFYEQRLHQRDAALAWLSRALAHGQTWREIDRAPILRDLRMDPRFDKLRHAA